MRAQMKIVVIDLLAERARMITAALADAGFPDVVALGETDNLLDRLAQIDPDAVLIDLAAPSRDMLEQMFELSRRIKRPVAMFVDESDSASITAAVEAGVGAYVVNGLHRERIKPVLDLAISRFNAFSRLNTELETTKAALAERKLVDRAKGILMKMKGIDEEEAYKVLRRTAMNQNRKIGDIAQSIVTAAEILN
ncbi:two-component system response regulator [Thalassobaculum fulvum]|uniref:Two-component system response regulator n=1 Tax=Thalassobaculum fulvum TaxID=1633335 RepID=A0A918XXD8_9PROT|nr:ANTAR domain-containing protein [Thalassobaculum fulvum]GHD62441.1 two-component system response regulator [Thalassobaculum fulvum]